MRRLIKPSLSEYRLIGRDGEPHEFQRASRVLRSSEDARSRADRRVEMTRRDGNHQPTFQLISAYGAARKQRDVRVAFLEHVHDLRNVISRNDLSFGFRIMNMDTG